MRDVNRRDFFGFVGVAAGAVLFARAVRPAEALAAAPVPGGMPAVPAPQPTSFLGISEGASIARWKVAKVYPVTFGAVPVVLEDRDGSRFQVDVLRKSESGPSGIGNSERLSLFLCNGGNGGLRTHEEHGLAAMALAQHFRSVEAGADLSSLLTLEERQARHHGGLFAVI